jgi:hypothetical protein
LGDRPAGSADGGGGVEKTLVIDEI